MATKTHSNVIEAALTVDRRSVVCTSSFETFLRKQREALLRFLQRRVSNSMDAEDVAQESLMRLARYRDSQPESAWKPLLYRIAVNAAHDSARRSMSALQCESLDFDRELPAQAPTLEERAQQQQELALIRDAILQLPPRCREVYVLNRFEEMSYSQIAAHMDISTKAVEKHIRRALLALHARLGGSPSSSL